MSPLSNNLFLLFVSLKIGQRRAYMTRTVRMKTLQVSNCVPGRFQRESVTGTFRLVIRAALVTEDMGYEVRMKKKEM